MKHADHFLNDTTPSILPTVYLNESRLVLMESPPLFPLSSRSYTIQHSFAGALPNSELEF